MPGILRRTYDAPDGLHVVLGFSHAECDAFDDDYRMACGDTVAAFICDLLARRCAEDLEALWIGLWCGRCGQEFRPGEPREPHGASLTSGLRHVTCPTMEARA